MRLGLIVSDGASYRSLAEMARSHGHDVEQVDLACEPASTAERRIGSVIEAADGLVIAGGSILGKDGADWDRRLHARIAGDSLRVLLVTATSDIERQNHFLFFYGMRVRAERCGSGERMSVKRSADAFRDPTLFAGVEAIELCGPMVLDLRAEASPVLTLRDDLCVDSTNGTQTVIAVWHALGGGAVLVSGESVMADEGSIRDSKCPGISANERFAANVLRFLVSGSSATLVQREPTAPELMDRVERTLADFVIGVLQSGSADWWYEHVPEKIRLEAVRIQEQEKGRYPKHAYLQLIQFREIIQANFTKFEPWLRAAGWSGGKEASTGWLVTLNEHRKLAAHPVKAHVSGHQFSDQDLAFIRDVDARVASMLRASKTPGG